MLLESPLCGRCHVLWAHRQPPCSAQSDAFQLQKVPQEGSTTAFVPTKQFPTAPHKCCILEPTLNRKKRPQSSSEAPNQSKYGLACTRRGANGLGLKSAAVPHLAKTQLDTLPSPPSQGQAAGGQAGDLVSRLLIRRCCHAQLEAWSPFNVSIVFNVTGVTVNKAPRASRGRPRHPSGLTVRCNQ